MNVPINIVVRTNVPWETMTLERFYAQQSDDLVAPIVTVTRTRKTKVIGTWETAYHRSFFGYRSMIRDTAQSHLETLGAERVTVGVDALDWANEDEEILVPVDDDDTFDRGLVKSLKQAFAPNVDLVVWPQRSWYLGQTTTRTHCDYLETCNWAVRKSFVRRAKRHLRDKILSHHWNAADMLADIYNPVTSVMRTPVIRYGARVLKMSVRSVELLEPLSTYYVHPGSISFLNNKAEVHADMVSYFRSLPLHPLGVIS